MLFWVNNPFNKWCWPEHNVTGKPCVFINNNPLWRHSSTTTCPFSLKSVGFSLLHTLTHFLPSLPSLSPLSLCLCNSHYFNSSFIFAVLFQLNPLFTAGFKNVTERRSLIRACSSLAHTRHYTYTHTHSVVTQKQRSKYANTHTNTQKYL